MKKEKLNMVFYVLIVLVVLLVLVLITINGKREMNNNIQQPNDVSATIPAGLKITTLVEGTGNAVKAGDTVAMNYTGTAGFSRIRLSKRCSTTIQGATRWCSPLISGIRPDLSTVRTVRCTT